MTHLLFYSGKSSIAWAIRWQTRSIYSHVAILIDDMVYESVEGKGVIARGVAKTDEKAAAYEVNLFTEETDEMENWLRQQTGKKYDYKMVMRFVSRRDKESEDTVNKWFCSELAYAAYRHVGVELFANTEPWEVSPGLLIRSPYLEPAQPNYIRYKRLSKNQPSGLYGRGDVAERGE